MRARLVAIAGPAEGEEFPLGEKVEIGRASVNTLTLEDGSLSRRHCVIRMEGGRFRIEDSGSSNGTFVNGIPVTNHSLESGDHIRVGRSVLLFLTDEAAAAPKRDPVEVDDGGLVAGSTVLLRVDDAIYLNAKKAVGALAENQRGRENLEALLRVGAAIREVRDLESLEQKLLQLILGLIPAERGAILLTGETPQDLLSAFYSQTSVAQPGVMKVSRTVLSRVIKDSVSVLGNDVQESGELASAQSLITARVRSLLVVPLIAFRRTLGAIYLDSGRPGARFDEDQLQLLTGIAGIAAAALDNALNFRNLQHDNQRLREELELEHDMVGDSPPMRKILEFVAKVAPLNSTVLVGGESGTGKELVARAIHRNSPRAGKPFVAINCAALTESLLESELFGHEKGAFTGAVTQKKGKLEEAEGGTVFLDEVGELAPGLQAKLLRVLQEREFERVGGTRTLKANIRLIAATNRDLDEAVRDGSFRRDLYYRLNVVPVTTPPLRERKQDIPLLANYFVQKYAVNVGRPVVGIAPEARAFLLSYEWPGNVRELENAIERAVVLGSTEKILVEDLPESVVEAGQPAGVPGTGFHQAVKEAKKQIVLKALDGASGSYVDAAKSLGLHPANLHRLMRNLGLRSTMKSRP